MRIQILVTVMTEEEEEDREDIQALVHEVIGELVGEPGYSIKAVISEAYINE